MALKRRRVLALTLRAAAALAGVAAAAPAAAQAGTPLVAAASDLKFALDEIIAGYRKAGGGEVRVSYGSSGNFLRQIAQDAPFELFLSADEDFVFKLADQGLVADRGALYAIGRLVLFAPREARWTPDSQFKDLGAALADGRITRLAIANPEHAPYGRAAQQALQATDLWPAAQARLVLGENVSQAAQFAVSGSAQAGLFAYSLALAPLFAKAGSHVLVPDALHAPLRQRMVLTRRAGAAARHFYAYLQQAEARAVFRRWGFVLPDGR